jgi:hypothetical protein
VDLPFFLAEDQAVQRINVRPADCTTKGHLGPMGAEMAGSRMSSGPELHGVRFKPGMPVPGQPLATSLSDPEQAMDSLKHNVALISSFPTSRFDVVGSTDKLECTRRDCHALAQRRAQLVRRWLIEMPTPPSSD